MFYIRTVYTTYYRVVAKVRVDVFLVVGVNTPLDAYFFSVLILGSNLISNKDALGSP